MNWKLLAIVWSFHLRGWPACAINVRSRQKAHCKWPHQGNFSSHPTFVWASKLGSIFKDPIDLKSPTYRNSSISHDHRWIHGKARAEPTSICALDKKNTSLNRFSPPPKFYYTASTLLIITAITIWKRDLLLAFNFKQFLNQNLEKLSSLGPLGLALYALGLLLWEMTIGVTTPVETAAGMAFGFTRGAIANGIGKMSGALLAFALGRFILRDFVLSKLQGNEYLDLIERSIQKGPIRVALIWRLSPLPEFIKNFGLAVLPLKMSHFAIAVVLHGLPFTLLWTFMGHEMGLVVRCVDPSFGSFSSSISFLSHHFFSRRGITSKPSRVLKILVGFVYLLGM